MPFAMLVKAKKLKNKKPTIAAGTAILTDLDRKTNTTIPANKQKMAVRVPDANIPLITKAATTRKNHLSSLNFVVIPKIINATADAAALQP